MAFGNAKIATGGQNDATNKSHDVFVPEIWGPAIELAMKEKLVFANYANDLSSFVAGGGDVIHLPQYDEISTGSKAAETKISYGNDGAAQTEITLNIDQHTYSAVLIEDILKVQSNYDLTGIYTREMGYALAKKIDEYLESQLFDSFKADGGAINTIDLSGALSSAANFDSILTQILAEDQDLTNWSLVLSPGAYADLANFVQLSYATNGAPLGQGFATTGQVGTLYGMPVAVSPNVTTASTNMDTGGGTDNQTAIGYCIHKSCMHIAYSQGVRMQADYDIDYLGTKLVGDMVYGCKVRNSSTAGQKRAFILD
tara:strand:- start:526 stop:1464 length:939 start_codon:yes stop_codon:yes gene_type:complete